MSIGKNDSIGRQLVNIWGLEILAAIKAKIIITRIVQQYHQYVGFLRLIACIAATD